MAKILIGIALAILCTSLLDGTGYTAFSALPLIPLFAMFAWLDRAKRKDLGLVAAKPADYVLALAHPLIVIAVLTALAANVRAIDLSAFDAARSLKNVAILSAATFLVAIVTEEGFFRGWLWAALTRRGAAPALTLIATTVAFVIWHVSFVFLSREFHFAPALIPVFFVNATLLGIIWGLLRLGSGSILVSSAGHGLWNGMTYVLFGIGSGAGALGIGDVALYGPEVGLVGAALNAVFALLLAWLFRDRLMQATEPVPNLAA
jgi:membrane protease YdiL (CAAX protease family)